MKAILYRADIPNVNGITYPRDELIRMVADQYRPLLAELVIQPQPLYVKLNMQPKYPPDSFAVDLERVAASVMLEFIDECVIANVKFLDTRYGRIAHSLQEITGLDLMPLLQGEVVTDIKNNGELVINVNKVINMKLLSLLLVPPASVDMGDEKELCRILDK